MHWYLLAILIWLASTVSFAAMSQSDLNEADKAVAKWRQQNEQLVSLYEAGQHAEATPLAEANLEFASDEFGEEHPTTLTSVNNLAFQYSSQGRYAEAEPFFVRALSVSERAWERTRLTLRIDCFRICFW